MIGCIEEAKEIAEFGISWDEYLEIEVPEGWAFLGEGAYRFAFRSPSGVVYKIENEDGEYERHNCREFENVQRCKEIPIQGWRLPEAHLYTVNGRNVMAMEYVPGNKDRLCHKSFEHHNALEQLYKCTCGKPNGRCTAEIWYEVFETWGIKDVHENNVHIEESGTRVLIDVADG